MVSTMPRTGMAYRHSTPPQRPVNLLDFSWEPTENFHDCERLLNSFWTEVGEHKKEKTREGTEVIPRKQWIEKEKKTFKETRETEERAALGGVQEPVSSGSDEDDMPLRELVGKSSQVIDSSDDDEPLSVSFRGPATFKETGLLQPQKHKPDVIALRSLQSPWAYLTRPYRSP
ncbi:hypothetical protein BDM02DRAFT_2673717 [Thelephora ganbajun]|uniref:Uncharacterized protein n=1 Tax=Thelephora ganbajun TaxID=370292 RepID=A0ACB6ZCY9_THEGA|nr:hypothetical protein BDM02DRAFT_2673717 [Thelephora ganbajun]